MKKSNVVEAGRLKLKRGTIFEQRVVDVKEKGVNDVWSSKNLHLHLQRLQTLIPKSVGNRIHIGELF